MKRLVVVSNRVASQSGAESAGGLSVGLHAALARCHGLWVGWNGEIDAARHEEMRVKDGLYRLVMLGLSEAEHEHYYVGFANRTLWPLLHGRPDLMRFDPADLSHYLAVNDRFARRTALLLSGSDVVWVHDYHFLALGQALRRQGAGQRIGFFLHVPFPDPDLVTRLPHHRELLGLLSAYDLVGFQSEACVRNFRTYVVRYLGGEACGDDVMIGGRRVRTGSFPIGIDVAGFSTLLASPEVQRFQDELRPCFEARAGIIGVDRLDYTKGLPLRLRAFERFLAETPRWRRRTFLTQIAAPSRESVAEYADLRDELDALSGRINARHSGVDWTPLRYINHALPRWRVGALLRLSRVGLVTPVADGMNLVAKEYVAAQDPSDPGVLVLSQFAGAAAQLDSALLVNPHDLGAVAAAIRQALEMPLEERRSRWSAAMAAVCAYDVHRWRERFLEALASEDHLAPLRLAHRSEGEAGQEDLATSAAAG